MFVDKHFKEATDSTREFRDLAQRASAVIEIIDPAEFAQTLLARIRTSLGTTGCAIFLRDSATARPYAQDGWTGERAVSVPLVDGRTQLGVLVLQPRSSGDAYTPAELESLRSATDALARIIRLRRVELRAETAD